MPENACAPSTDGSPRAHTNGNGMSAQPIAARSHTARAPWRSIAAPKRRCSAALSPICSARATISHTYEKRSRSTMNGMKNGLAQ